MKTGVKEFKREYKHVDIDQIEVSCSVIKHSEKKKIAHALGILENPFILHVLNFFKLPHRFKILHRKWSCFVRYGSIIAKRAAVNYF